MEYTWSNDYGTCTAKRVCQNDTGHVETENATKITENIIKAATCEGVGKKTYKAEFNSFTSCETEELDIPATGHKCNDTWEHNETQHWKVCETCKENVNAANHTDENSDGMCDVCGYVTAPDTYTVSGTVYTWDNTDSNTTRVRLYDKDVEEKVIKSDIQHDITDESYTKTCQYDAKLIGDMEKESTSNRYTQSFEFTGVANGEYKLAAWRPAYDISNKHYAYAVRITDVTVNGADVTVDENATKLWLYGDVNGDGKINTIDATNISAYVVGNNSSINEDNKEAADANGDGKINTIDATNVSAYVVGNSSSLDDKK